MRIRKGWFYMSKLINRTAQQKHEHCVLLSSKDSSRINTKGQFRLLVELECKYLIKIDYTKIPHTLHDYTNKIQDILKGIKDGRVRQRKVKKNFELEFNILLNTVYYN